MIVGEGEVKLTLYLLLTLTSQSTRSTVHTTTLTGNRHESVCVCVGGSEVRVCLGTVQLGAVGGGALLMQTDGGHKQSV